MKQLAMQRDPSLMEGKSSMRNTRNETTEKPGRASVNIKYGEERQRKKKERKKEERGNKERQREKRKKKERKKASKKKEDLDKKRERKIG